MNGIVHKRLIILMLSFFVGGCVAPPTQDQIPKAWLKYEVGIEDVHKFKYQMCLKIQDTISVIVDGKLQRKEKCIKTKRNPFLFKVSDKSKIFYYETPKKYWDAGYGHRGFVLENNGIVVDVEVTNSQKIKPNIHYRIE